MAIDKLVADAIYRFKRLIIPEMTSPLESFWGGEKQLILNRFVEIARVNLSIPSFFTVEIVMPDAGTSLNTTFNLQIGIGRTIIEREFLGSDLTGLPPASVDPLFQLSFDSSTSSVGRIRFVVWGTSIKITARANSAGGAQLFKVSVTPGAGALTSAYIAGVSPFVAFDDVANTATVVSVAQNAANVAIRSSLLGLVSFLGCTIYNNAGVDLFLRDSSDGNPASTSDFSRRVPPLGVYIMDKPFYTGLINGIWAAAGAGSALVTCWSRV